MLYGHVETPAERVGHLIKLRELQAESLARHEAFLGERHEGTKARRHEELPESSVASAALRASVPDAFVPAFFNCMIPLSFVPEHSELGHLPGPTGLTDLKTLAVARLMLNNVAHIKAFWIMQGIGLSQAALSWGCDDLDGTVVWYDITKRLGDSAAPTHQELHVNDIRRVIREAGREPVERDTLYRPVRRDAETGQVLRGEPALV
jgi:aminodeoxyfutalosine synthase